MNSNRAKRGFNKPVFFWRCPPRNFENETLVARRREHFRGFLAIFLVAQLPPKRGVLWVEPIANSEGEPLASWMGSQNPTFAHLLARVYFVGVVYD